LILAAIRVFPDEAALIEMRVYEPRGRPDDGIRSGHRPGEPFGVGRCAVTMIFKAAAARCESRSQVLMQSKLGRF